MRLTLLSSVIALAAAAGVDDPGNTDCPDCPPPAVFLDWHHAGDLCADHNRDGAVTVQDIFDFLADWFTSCTG